MIEEVSVVNAYADYREAMNKAKTIKEDVVLMTLHGENGRKLHAPITVENLKMVVQLFDAELEKKRCSFVHS